MNAAASVTIREALSTDFEFVSDLMQEALEPYYGGDHRAHAERIFSAHIQGGIDPFGYFSLEQRMWILSIDNSPAGMLHLVRKRQGTYKISPIIIAKVFQGKRGLGSLFLHHAEEYARSQGARQVYCTVAEDNFSALQFFLKKDYHVAGKAASQYKDGVVEVMLYKQLREDGYDEDFDKHNISVLPYSEEYEAEVRRMLLDKLPEYFAGVNPEWVDQLLAGYRRRDSRDINVKYKLIYVAVDRTPTVLGLISATPKKGEPINIKPFVASTLPAFWALLADIPQLLRDAGRKLYIHLVPSVEETVALQSNGWMLDAVMPAAYHPNQVTQQWSLDLSDDAFMRTMRVKQHYLNEIKSGAKTLEVRVGYDNIKTIQPGERIKLVSHNEAVTIRVRDVRRYQSISETLAAEDSRRIVPNGKGDAERVLRMIYPPDKERLGIYVLEIGLEG